jgi:hypothetical protein
MVKPTHQRGLVPYPDQETTHMIRTPKAAALLFAVTIPLLFAASCTPEEIALYGTMNADEQAAVKAHLQAQAAPAAPAHNPPGGFLACVRRHESGGNYRAENPTSTASGAYQWLDSSWRSVSRMAGYSGWGHAADAPPHIQDAVSIWAVNNGYRSAWNGTGC